MTEDIKVLIKFLFNEIDKLGKVIGRKNYHTEAADEMLEYLMYLSYADDDINWSEILKIGIFLGCSDLNPINMEEYIEAHNIGSEKYENTIPSVFKLLVDQDNIKYQKNHATETYLSEIMVTTYKAIGKDLVESDNSTNKYEYSSFYTYEALLNDYLDKHLAARTANNN